eukprot:GDKK01070150.1.p1 GENE.GDKK01070150.1~~GDKK01070150.1.p1  ORF type:complete len:144 (+),score=8.71 GDKK01070150.1:45-434(+)
MTHPSYEVLSNHVFIAIFEGISHQPCRFMTSMCPDRCNHSKDVAHFKVTQYISYEKNGQFGDDKQEIIYFGLTSQDHSSDRQDPAIIEEVRQLKKGDTVRIHYEHIYCTDESGSKWPERPFRSIDVIAR